jgi:misacylated tRNA(Ala) deacylase
MTTMTTFYETIKVLCRKNRQRAEFSMKKEFDPRMHSAEHILNQTMDRIFHCGRSIAAHIETKKSKCDYPLNRPLTEEEVRQVERQVNEVIRADMRVMEEHITRDEAGKLYNLARLPGDAGDSIRIVKIGDYDACPCIGPHVASTGEIGEFCIASVGFEEGVFRIRFKLRV